MREFGRSEYWFDPTANNAIARVDKSSVIIHKPSIASPKDIALYTGVPFEPDRLIGKGLIRRNRWVLNNLNKK